jgi:hypothetical protein
MLRSASFSFLVASATTFAVWALSPWLTGYNEPWDAPGIYYYVALLAAGAVSGLLTGKPLWAQYVGSIFGQLLYGLLFLPLGPLAAAGLLFLVLWSLIFLAGAYIGARMRTRAMGR